MLKYAETSHDLSQESLRLLNDSLHGITFLPGLAALTYSNALSKYQDTENIFGRIDGDIAALLQQSGYNANFFDCLDRLDDLQSLPSFWEGEYVLFDDHGSRYVLDLHTDGAAFFANERITEIESSFPRIEFFSGEYHAVLDFSISSEFLNLADGAQALADHFQGIDALAYAPMLKIVSGTIERKNDATTHVQGKLGSYSFEASRSAEAGDPASFWNGEYSLILTDKTRENARPAPDTFLFLTRAESPHVRWVRYGGKQTVEATNFGNNTLWWSVEDNVACSVSFSCDALGKRRVGGVFSREGVPEAYFSGIQTRRIDLEPTRGMRIAALNAQSSATISTSVLPTGTPGTPYFVSLVASSPSAIPGVNQTWTARDLPAGISLDPQGTLYGTIAQNARDTSTLFTVQIPTAVDQNNIPTAFDTASRKLSMHIVQKPLTITTTAMNALVLNKSYSFTFNATGGVLPYTWSTTACPAGLSMDSTSGTLSGTPTDTSSSQTVTLAVKDSAGTSLTQSFSTTCARDAEAAAWTGPSITSVVTGVIALLSTLTTLGVTLATYFNKTTKEIKKTNLDIEKAKRENKHEMEKIKTTELEKISQAYSKGVYDDYHAIIKKSWERVLNAAPVRKGNRDIRKLGFDRRTRLDKLESVVGEVIQGGELDSSKINTVEDFLKEVVDSLRENSKDVRDVLSRQQKAAEAMLGEMRTHISDLDEAIRQTVDRELKKRLEKQKRDIEESKKDLERRKEVVDKKYDVYERNTRQDKADVREFLR